MRYYGKITDPKDLVTKEKSTELAQQEIAAAIDPSTGTAQAKLVSGTNIKTINNQDVLGSGNLEIGGLPSQTGQNGKFLTTDGSSASWATVDMTSKEDVANKITSISSSSTDTEYPSAKCVYDNAVAPLSDKQSIITATGILKGTSSAITSALAADIPGVTYLTSAPTADNTDGLKFVVLSAEPETKYNGYLYIITEA